jgi:hypothetical protein
MFFTEKDRDSGKCECVGQSGFYGLFGLATDEFSRRKTIGDFFTTLLPMQAVTEGGAP